MVVIERRKQFIATQWYPGLKIDGVIEGGSIAIGHSSAGGSTQEYTVSSHSICGDVVGRIAPITIQIGNWIIQDENLTIERVLTDTEFKRRYEPKP